MYENLASVATNSRETLAAGAVVFRTGWEVLLVHRPKYGDWSFPKGKLDRGEHVTAAAVREVAEETGVRVRLLRPLLQQRYPIRGGRKVVSYWTARVAAGTSDSVEGYVREGEIDRVAWVPFDVALKQLTYPRDRATLREALRARKLTRTIVVVRHAESWSRRAWHADDRQRPLLVRGRRQASALAPVLAAYDVGRVVTSGSARCVETVAPYAASRGVLIEEAGVLSEEEGTREDVRELIRAVSWDAGRTGGRGPTAVCSHRPVLPWIFEALGVPDPKLEKGELVVLQLRGGKVRSTERWMI
jgi:8-oxo-(d)GTP phosphatase